MSFGRRIFACCSLTVYGLIFFNGFAFLFTPFISSAACDPLLAVVVCIDVWPLFVVHLLRQILPSAGFAVCTVILGWFVADSCLAAIIHAVGTARAPANRAGARGLSVPEA